MAEVVATFGAISSVLQVVSFTTQIVKHAREVVKDGRDASYDNVRTERLALEYRELSENVSAIFSGHQLSAEEAAVVRQQKEYHAEAEKLIARLQGLRISPDGTKAQRVRDGTRKAVRAVRERKDIDKQRVRLGELNSCLGTSLLQLLISRHTEQMGQIMKFSDELRDLKDEQKVLGLEKRLKHMHRDVLASLKFTSMASRYNFIEETYPSTYEWAVQSDAYGLKSWLRAGTGIFWISGKAGSGTSTLLKFLDSNKEILALLKEWSGPKLLKASFYFWYLGDSEQKSIRGLIRTILWELIRDDATLGPIAFPDFYNGIPLPVAPMDWSDEELLAALKRVCANTTQHICLFIDGLDEYSGDQTALVVLLRTISQSSLIKICVSSRP